VDVARNCCKVGIISTRTASDDPPEGIKKEID
jgi:hypothetical protein